MHLTSTHSGTQSGTQRADAKSTPLLFIVPSFSQYYNVIVGPMMKTLVRYIRLSMSNTARGSCTGLVTLGPTKV